MSTGDGRGAPNNTAVEGSKNRLSVGNPTAIAIAAPLAAFFGLALAAAGVWLVARQVSKRRAREKAREERAKGVETGDGVRVRERAGGGGGSGRREVWDMEVLGVGKESAV
ncbi:hypothetical protein ACHAQA_004312 [Verticillium albo-atrum]